MHAEWSNGTEFEVSKKCGPPEHDDLDYNEGCDSIDVPYRQTICYCKENLCNGSDFVQDNFFFMRFIFLKWIISHVA